MTNTRQHPRSSRTWLLPVAVVVGVAATGWAAWLWIDSMADDDAAASTSLQGVPEPVDPNDGPWTVTVTTNRGDITVELDGEAAPQAVGSFVHLSTTDFFDDSVCHRLTTQGIFVLQCGDPTGTGTGGPDYRFGPVENAPEDTMYPAGTLAMARVGGNAYSMGSQFFLVYSDSFIPSDNAGGYTVFGHIVEGLDIVEDVARAGTVTGGPDGPPAAEVIIIEVSVQ